MVEPLMVELLRVEPLGRCQPGSKCTTGRRNPWVPAAGMSRSLPDQVGGETVSPGMVFPQSGSAPGTSSKFLPTSLPTQKQPPE